MRIGQYVLLASLTVLIFVFQNFTTNSLIKIDSSGTYIKVEDFGALGDGKTDDTLAIQKAIKFAFDNRVQRLIFQPLTYLLSKPKYCTGEI